MTDELKIIGTVLLVLFLIPAYFGTPVVLGIFCRKCFKHARPNLPALLAMTMTYFLSEKAQSRNGMSQLERLFHHILNDTKQSHGVSTWVDAAIFMAMFLGLLSVIFRLARWGVSLADGSERKPKSIPT